MIFVELSTAPPNLPPCIAARIAGGPDVRTVAVVGASLAGLSAARALREQGYDGRLVLVGDETHRPYDRPPLSKEFLAGHGEADLALETDDEDLAPSGCWAPAPPASTPRPVGAPRRRHRHRADGIVIATGARARTLPGTEGLAGVHTLRTLDDARALRDELCRRRPARGDRRRFHRRRGRLHRLRASAST